MEAGFYTGRVSSNLPRDFLPADNTRWVAKEARPISLRQLMFFGRSLTEARLISSANYVRTELPTRLVSKEDGIQVVQLISLLDWRTGSETCKHSHMLSLPTLI